MITEKELKKELKASKRMYKFLVKDAQTKELWQDLEGYIDGLTFALKGKLD